MLEGIATDNLTDHPDIWEDVVKRLGADEMPPRQVTKRPDLKVAHAMVASLIADLDGVARKEPYAGRTVIRRLNRTEYSNAVRDLLDIDFTLLDELPADGVANGFDNIADSLSMSPLLLESYLKMARRVTELAIGEGDPSPVTDRYPATKSQAVWQGEGMPSGTRGGVLVKKYFPRDGDYDLRAFLSPADMTATEGVRFFHIRQHVTTGPHTFIVTFPQSVAAHEGPVPMITGPGGAGLGGPLDARGLSVKPSLILMLDGKLLKRFDITGPSPSEAAFGAIVGPPVLSRAEITGPYNAGPPANTASRRHILICELNAAAHETACANRILTQLLRRAWRRTVTPAEVKPFAAVYASARKDSDFAGAIAVALRQILVSPGFLFRLEFDPKAAKPGKVYQVSDFDFCGARSRMTGAWRWPPTTSGTIRRYWIVKPAACWMTSGPIP